MLFLRRLIFLVLTYPFLILTGCGCWLWMYVLNTTVVIGRENIPRRTNVLIIANHLTLIDSWFIAMACYWPSVILRPWLIPWHVPEAKNFYKKVWLAVLCTLWKCIPIRRRSGNFLKKLPILIDRLTHGTMIVFPEGTRNRDPNTVVIQPLTRGAAILAIRACALVVPVGIAGMEQILPIGAHWPRSGKKIVVVIGKPIPVSVVGLNSEEQQKIILTLFEQRLTAVVATAREKLG